MAAPKLGVYFWVRVAVMIVALVGVLSLMSRLRGGSGGTADLVPAVSAGFLRLCPTRVASVSLIGKTAVFQDGLKWFRTGSATGGGERQELDGVAVEKWFSSYCSIPIEEAAAPGPGSQPLLTLAYVSGLPMTLSLSPDGVFSWKDRSFRSPKLNEALQSLNELPTARAPGHTGP